MRTILFVLSIFIITSCEVEEKRTPVDVKTLVSDWVSLTEMDGKQVIFNSCDGGNSITTIGLIDGKYYLYLHGTQEDNYLVIKEAYKKESDTIYFTTIYRGTEEESTQKFILIDKAKQLAYWKFMYLEGDYDDLTVNAKNQSEFENIEQPCRECFDDEICREFEFRDSLNNNLTPIQRIKYLFDDYERLQENTDSEINKFDAENALSKIDNVYTYEDFEILLNFWMYYDTTNFNFREDIKEILKNNKPKSIDAIKSRLKNKRENEMEEQAPYIDLKHLLQEIENN